MLKHVEHMLAATNFSRNKDAQLATKLHRPLLPTLGYNENLLLILRCNPPFILGLEWYDPYPEQGLRKLELFVTHGGLGIMTGQSLQTSLEHHQL